MTTATSEIFDPVMTAGFPEPARRWLCHAPGTPLWSSVELTMHGRIKLGRWRLLRLIPVLTAAGPDVTRSARGRMAGEIALIPTAFRYAAWTPSEHADTAVATWQFGDDTEPAELRVEAEARFGGITIPSAFRAGWWWGTERQHEGEFFRAEITGAVFS